VIGTCNQCAKSFCEQTIIVQMVKKLGKEEKIVHTNKKYLSK